MERRLFTSESVTEGHPDKMCDAISDAILDALMEKDPMSRVACETVTTTGLVMLAEQGTHDVLLQKNGIYSSFICSRKEAVSGKMQKHS